MEESTKVRLIAIFDCLLFGLVFALVLITFKQRNIIRLLHSGCLIWIPQLKISNMICSDILYCRWIKCFPNHTMCGFTFCCSLSHSLAYDRSILHCSLTVSLRQALVPIKRVHGSLKLISIYLLNNEDQNQDQMYSLFQLPVLGTRFCNLFVFLYES